MRDACATQSCSPRFSSSRRLFALASRHRRRPLLHRVKWKRSRLSLQQPVSDIPLDLSPASASVITSEDFEQKQIERVSDTLREVHGALGCPNRNSRPVDVSFHTRIAQRAHPGLARWHPDQSRLAGRVQLCRSDHRRYRQDRSGARPRAPCTGPRALAGVITNSTKQGTGTCTRRLLVARGGIDTRSPADRPERRQNWQLDYSVDARPLDTDNARQNNNYRNTAAITDVGWSPDEAIADRQPLYLFEHQTGKCNTHFDPRPIEHFFH